MRVTVVGLGKIGLPLAAQYANKGHQVIGVDINAETVATVNAGREPFPGEAHLADHLGRLVPAGRLRATTSYSDAIPEADVVVIVVPLFVDDAGTPDFGWMDSATHDIGRHLTPDTLVCYETTLPVGTTRTRWKPMLEADSGLTEGIGFHVAFSPERVLTGRVFEDLRRYPKIVGGLSPQGAKAAVGFYETVLDFDDRPDLAKPNGVWDIGSAEAAELTKLAETTYRDVNIGLANQFALFAEKSGIDVFQVIEASNSQPYSHIHQPGISVGGHCIPVYPRLYLSNDPEASIVAAAREMNTSMPAHAASLLKATHGDLENVPVLVLGAAYRGGVKETAFSGVFDLVKALVGYGARPVVHDPMYSENELVALGLPVQPLGFESECAVVHTDHASYRGFSSEDLPRVRTIVDGRRIIDAGRFPDAVVVTLGAAPGSAD